MGLLDTLLGRTKPVKANLDALFALPPAQVTLQVREQLLPTGQAGICFKPASGPGFGDAEREIRDLLALDDAGTAASAGTLGSDAAGSLPTGAGSGSSGAGALHAALSESSDEYGYRWIVLESGDFDTLVTRTHFVNSTLDEHGWSPQLLCSVFGFAPAPGAGDPAGSEASVAPGAASMYLVYLYKRASFYPFVPLGGERRDNEAELRLKAELSGDLPIEADLDRWFPIWKLPLR